jgi:anti-anti-sigma regulatory factor
MLRITEHLENGKTVRLRLDGTISLQSFDELKDVCSRHLEENRRMIILDMSGVDFMNDEAASRLAELQNESLRIINCSPFIATLLETVGRMD